MFQISSKMVVARSLARTSASSAISTSGLKHFAPTPNLEDIPGIVFYLDFSIPFLFGHLSVFSIWTFLFLFYLVVYIPFQFGILYPFSFLIFHTFPICTVLSFSHWFSIIFYSVGFYPSFDFYYFHSFFFYSFFFRSLSNLLFLPNF